MLQPVHMLRMARRPIMILYDNATKKRTCVIPKTGFSTPNKIPWIQLSPELKNTLNLLNGAIHSRNYSIVTQQNNDTQVSNLSASTIKNSSKILSRTSDYQTSNSGYLIWTANYQVNGPYQ
jgi:hypothetical protein